MKRFLSYSFLGLIAYAVFMLLQFPAARFINQVVDRLPGLSVQSVEGSVVRGRVQDIRLRDAHVASIAWQLRFLSLLIGRIEYRFTAQESELQLRGVIGIDLDRQLRIAELTGHLPLPRAIALIGQPASLLHGEVEFEQVDLQLGKDGLPRAAQGMMRLRNVRSDLGNSLVLGDFNAELDTREPHILAVIRDLGGPLEFTGTLTLTSDGRYRFSGQAAVRDNNNRQLRQVLSLLGQPARDGKWTLDFTGVLQV